MSHVLRLKGSFLYGLFIQFENGSEFELFKNKWYEWILICLPMVGILFGVLFCGRIGGGLSALFGFLAAFINAQILRSPKMPLALRVFLSLLLAIVFNLIWFGIYLGIATALVMAYPELFPYYS